MTRNIFQCSPVIYLASLPLGLWEEPWRLEKLLRVPYSIYHRCCYFDKSHETSLIRCEMVRAPKGEYLMPKQSLPMLRRLLDQDLGYIESRKALETLLYQRLISWQHNLDALCYDEILMFEVITLLVIYNSHPSRHKRVCFRLEKLPEFKIQYCGDTLRASPAQHQISNQSEPWREVHRVNKRCSGIGSIQISGYLPNQSLSYVNANKLREIGWRPRMSRNHHLIEIRA